MIVSFPDAARRHFRDADRLRRAGRLPNADQLFGLAAECALKGGLRALGMPVTLEGDPQRRAHKLHVNELWPLTVALLAERAGGRWLAVLGDADPYSDWRVDQRYAADESAPSRAAVKAHRDAAGRAARLLDAVTLDGFVG